MAVINTATIVIRDDKRACGRAIKIGMCGIAGVVKKAGERDSAKGAYRKHTLWTHTPAMALRDTLGIGGGRESERGKEKKKKRKRENESGRGRGKESKIYGI